ncbi:MAG: hypothetical protein J0I19_16000 [Alphaproteobacteria bacterium]|nr:hypothetical protein [Alphaproteobacteria bacterium]
MRIEAFAMGFLLLAAPALAQTPQKLPLPHMPGQQSLQFGNANIAITLPAPESPAPIIVTASAPGTRPVSLFLEHIPGAHEFAPSVSLVEMDPGNSTPEFFISRFSGGAHCCAEIHILDLVAGQWRIIDGGSWNGDEIIPEDADGDGEQEIVHGDDRFLYRYSCYACAAPPMRVFKLIQGALADVTLSPLYRPRDEKDLPNFQQGCANHDNGACASYVAVASRLGRHDEAWHFMLDHYDRKSDWGLKDCALRDDKGNCLADIQYKSYPDALAAFLQQIDSARPGMP